MMARVTVSHTGTGRLPTMSERSAVTKMNERSVVTMMNEHSVVTKRSYDIWKSMTAF